MPLIVDVVPRSGFDYLPDDASRGRATCEVPPPGRPLTLDFDLLANEAGPGEVTVTIRQGAMRRLLLNLRSEVAGPRSEPARAGLATSSGTVGGAESAASGQAGAPAATGADGSIASLTIFDRRNGGVLQFEYILETDDVYDRFASKPVEVDPETYVRQTYDRIEQAWLGSRRALDVFERDLAGWGGQMFARLFPVELQKQLWKLARHDELAGIAVHSDEPFLPWEMVFLCDPDNPDPKQGRFLAELGVCRWLYGAVPVRSIAVRRGRARYVIPHYPDKRWRLPGAEEVEEPFLKKTLGAKAVKPLQADVIDLLQTPASVDLLHFACHGSAEPGDIDASALLLEGEIVQTPQGSAWAKESLLASTVALYAGNLRGPDGSRPLVVVNACQTGRVGRSLTGIGGFASAFIGSREGSGDSRGRAGAYVGALWSVGDQPATTFVQALYNELKAGRTMSQASRAARQAARAAGEATWLAYTVYAHPLLKVAFG